MFGSTELTSSGSNDMFIVKYDASGNVLWANKGGGINPDGGNGIAVDAGGNSYVTGMFQGSATFGSTVLTSSGSTDAFIVKYDASGNMLWAQKGGGTSADRGESIAVDTSGNSYITGAFYDSVTFGSTVLTNSGIGDVFIVKYDALGNVLWAKKGGGANNDAGLGIAVDASGNSYVAGYFSVSATFDSTALTSSGTMDVFVVKYDASGNVLWAKKGGGTSDDLASGIDVDAGGNSYVTGVFYGSAATFGSTVLMGSGNADAFIVKYDALGKKRRGDKR